MNIKEYLTDKEIVEVLKSQGDYVYDNYNKKHTATLGDFKYIYRDWTKKLSSFYVQTNEMDCNGMGYMTLLTHVTISNDVKELEQSLSKAGESFKKKFKI